jgi:plastocyanin domain-containing protein
MVLEHGVNTLTLSLEEPGTYAYSCGIGMFWGSMTAAAAPPPL